jgi:large subunit ribosomal protein L22
MEAKASIKHVRMSPRKVRIVANMIRGKQVDDALGILKFVPKKSAKVLHKLLVAAVANAEHNSQEDGGKLDVDELCVSKVLVDQGPTIKRWLSRSMGRANRINHKTSHIQVWVGEAE